MTEQEAIAYIRSCGEQDGPESYEEAAEVFHAMFGRQPDRDDGDAAALFSACCAAVRAI